MDQEQLEPIRVGFCSDYIQQAICCLAQALQALTERNVRIRDVERPLSEALSHVRGAEAHVSLARTRAPPTFEGEHIHRAAAEVDHAQRFVELREQLRQLYEDETFQRIREIFRRVEERSPGERARFYDEVAATIEYQALEREERASQSGGSASEGSETLAPSSDSGSDSS